ncbi:ATP-binding protein, partial [Bifidobacterium adolescentis]|uniref:ATP-binding protein n=1 Tax=Bifidobacterium adolescentis TaxID=1680 RepID=UPI0034A5AF12
PAAPLHPWIPESEGIHRTGTRPLRNRPTHRCQSRLRRAEREDRLDTELRQIAKARLLIIDEFGYMPIDEEGSRLLFQVISDSYETRSVVYTTNIEFSGWGRVLGDKNMAAALIDRTVHHGRLAGFEGGSYRSEHALMTR